MGFEWPQQFQDLIRITAQTWDIAKLIDNEKILAPLGGWELCKLGQRNYRVKSLKQIAAAASTIGLITVQISGWRRA